MVYACELFYIQEECNLYGDSHLGNQIYSFISVLSFWSRAVTIKLWWTHWAHPVIFQINWWSLIRLEMKNEPQSCCPENGAAPWSSKCSKYVKQMKYYQAENAVATVVQSHLQHGFLAVCQRHSGGLKQDEINLFIEALRWLDLLKGLPDLWHNPFWDSLGTTLKPC